MTAPIGTPPQRKTGSEARGDIVAGMSRVLTLGDAAVAALTAFAAGNSSSSRPPIGVYNVSIGQVTHRLERLLDVLDVRPAALGPTSPNPKTVAFGRLT
jgi:hypothetical protein